MKKFIFITIVVFLLTGCIGENYSVGHPITEVEVNNEGFKLKAARIEWNTQGDTTSLTEDNIDSLLNESEAITVQPDQTLKATFTDSINDKGEYTDIDIKVFASKENNKQTLYEMKMDSSMLDEDHIFEALDDAGVYLLEVEFMANGNFAKYVGKLVVQ